MVNIFCAIYAAYRFRINARKAIPGTMLSSPVSGL
jgi:hypothetical protein